MMIGIDRVVWCRNNDLKIVIAIDVANGREEAFVGKGRLPYLNRTFTERSVRCVDTKLFPCAVIVNADNVLIAIVIEIGNSESVFLTNAVACECLFESGT